MKVVFSSIAWDSLLEWSRTDRTLFDRITTLIEDARRHPFTGLGKPEPLRGNLKGFWSRRITGEHRLIYRVAGTGDDQRIEVAACRHHY